MSSIIFAYCSNGNFLRKRQDNENFYKRSYQSIQRYFCTEAIKRRGEISLHRHFKKCFVRLKKLRGKFAE